MKFARINGQHRYRLDDIETALYSFLISSKGFDEVCQIEYRYLDDTFADQSDIALALIHLLEKGLLQTINN